ncbi:hypothetical protein PSH03_004904 [Micromonospora sp. PSH03]|uniref:hypothetical protein n=1 Tax=Micromonospora TaxID=1873 RepID=UPI001B38CBAA|nr:MULTISPECIES: hypothetical protein [Micromonospora]MBQ0989918.1 hypothetical protein [Micromonospora sp. H61]MCG5459137.1 hypothetical protein [Micromonospora salmantinae]
MADRDGALTLVAIVEFTVGAEAAGRRYEDAVLALLDRHGGRLERRLRGTDGQTEVHVIRFDGRVGYESFLADPDRAALRTALGAAAPTTRVVEVHEG